MNAPVRHFAMPATLGGRVHFLRFTFARRTVQFALLLLFYGTAHWAWTVVGQPLLEGNFSAAKFAGVVPLADPFALLQAFASGHLLAVEAWTGAAVTLALWIVFGGRAFCAWACPLNVVTDLAAWLRGRLALRDLVHIGPRVRYALLGIALALSALAGIAAFEGVSPIGMLHRGIVFGSIAGLVVVVAVFLFDFAALRHGWCGHLCPLGAFWSLAGRAGVLKVRFNDTTCTRCGDCVRVCPEPRVLNFPRAAQRAFVDAGECMNCGRCVAMCPEGSLSFGARPFARVFPTAPPSTGQLP